MHPPVVIFEIMFPLFVTTEELREIVSRATKNRHCVEEDFYRNNEHFVRFVVCSPTNITGNFFLENPDHSENLFCEKGVFRRIRIRSFLPRGRNGKSVSSAVREEWNRNAAGLNVEIRKAFNVVKQWKGVI